MPVNWPSLLDYQEAVQHPNTSFKHSSLSRSQAILNKMGLPRVSAGSYACVFKLQCKQQNYAVRCFSNPVTDQQRRYTLLSEHLRKYTSSYLVNFEYLADGICVNGRWFPIVLMEWVEGQTLDSYIGAKIQDNNAIARIAAQWRGLVGSLRGAFMAHGDLQHGNVIMGNNGQMSLVDYDGMFIKRMLGERSPETGHVNYQHPGRTPANFNDSIDNFSALCIYLSLRALVADPALWRFNTGQNLILSSQDYANVKSGKRSEVFDALIKSRDSEVRDLAAKLKDYCRKSLSEVPYMENILQGIGSEPVLINVQEPFMGAATPEVAVSRTGSIDVSYQILRNRTTLELELTASDSKILMPRSKLIIKNGKVPQDRGDGIKIFETPVGLTLGPGPTRLIIDTVANFKNTYSDNYRGEIYSSLFLLNEKDQAVICLVPPDDKSRLRLTEK